MHVIRKLALCVTALLLTSSALGIGGAGASSITSWRRVMLRDSTPSPMRADRFSSRPTSMWLYRQTRVKRLVQWTVGCERTTQSSHPRATRRP